MIYIEKQIDLFSISNDYYLAQCISADLKMGTGIAMEFNRRFDMKNKITELYPDGYLDSNGNYERVGCVLIDNVFNLITKKKYWDKPTYDTIRDALYSMRDICINNEICKVAMPAIGCGLDRLQLSKVREIIKKVFEYNNIEILLCIN